MHLKSVNCRKRSYFDNSMNCVDFQRNNDTFMKKVSITRKVHISTIYQKLANFCRNNSLFIQNKIVHVINVNCKKIHISANDREFCKFSGK